MKEKNLNSGNPTSHIPPHTSSEGITLIALVITIIVMLILVTVSVTMAINGGLFGYAKNAVDETQAGVDAEQGLANGDIIDQWVNGDGPLPELAGEKVTENSVYTSGGKTAVIPTGFTVSGKASESTIDGGLVIYLIDDKTEEEIAEIDWENDTTLQTTYDQFVWIPVEDINDMYMCQSEGTDTDESGTVEDDEYNTCKITVENGEAKCTTHNSNKMAGRLYATSTGNNFNTSLTTQTYKANEGIREPDTLSMEGYDGDTTNLGNLNTILGTSYATIADVKADLQSEYNTVVKSVYENQGFYVGRYETSNMTTTDGTAVKVVAGTTSGINKINWYYMYAQQKDYAKNNGLSVGSTMIQGAAYDQVMKFVDSNNTWIKTTGRVSHDRSYNSGPWQTGGLNYSGTITYNDVAKNIYDLEGNVSAWTTEAYGTLSRVLRGGWYGSGYSASCRSLNNPDYDYNIGSLAQLYI